MEGSSEAIEVDGLLSCARSQRFSKRVAATLIAASMVAASPGYALALERLPEDAAATASGQIEDVGMVLDIDDTIKAAYDAELPGAAALESYLAGCAVSEEDFLAIDVDALASIDVSLSKEIASVKERILATDSDGAQGEDDPSENAAEGSEDGDADGSGDEPSVSPAPGEEGEAGSDEGGAVAPSIDSPADAASGAEDDSSDVQEAYVSPYPQWSYSGDTAYVARDAGVDLTTEKFVSVIGEQAREIAQEQDLYASVMIAQAILESDSGNSSLSQAPSNNLFGIKGSYGGSSVIMRTLEDDGSGSLHAIGAQFRSYSSIRESLEDYAALLSTGLGGYYAPAWKSNADTFVDACNYLEGRYATDIFYSEKLQDLIETYDLARFDEPLGYKTVATYCVQAEDPETGKPLYDAATGEAVMEQRDLVDLVSELTSHLGTEYVWAASTPSVGFDCSGLVQYCYREALGIELPRTTYYQCLEGSDVDFDDLIMGDLLFFTNEENEASHVAVYLGEGCYIEAPQEGDVVKVTSLEEKMPAFAKRIVEVQFDETKDSAGSRACGRLQLDLADGAIEVSEASNESARASSAFQALHRAKMIFRDSVVGAILSR